MFPNWSVTLIAVATTFHSLAILSTLFRLWSRWYMERIWWDDVLALVALLADTACLVATWLEQPIPGGKIMKQSLRDQHIEGRVSWAADIPKFFTTGNWILCFAFPTVIWASRISILISVARVSQPVGMLKCIAVGIGAAFGIIWLGILGQRIQVCLANGCLITRPVSIVQTIVDCIADALLTGLPILFLRDVKLSRRRRLLILSTFSASMVINMATVAHAVVLLQFIVTPGTIIVGHIKYALSLIVCNLLVIVTWVYRIINKNGTGLDDSQLEANKVELTTVDLAQPGFNQEMTNSSAATKSSSWSFRGPGRSGVPSAVTGVSRMSGV